MVSTSEPLFFFIIFIVVILIILIYCVCLCFYKTNQSHAPIPNGNQVADDSIETTGQQNTTEVAVKSVKVENEETDNRVGFTNVTVV
mmetsp:Transcript_21223/g.30689  ORF Transcript_21223/g.30689 Transcript_21223/m.30689 type:complete len:87 (-) Transcript_21223:275-535(-)